MTTVTIVSKFIEDMKCKKELMNNYIERIKSMEDMGYPSDKILGFGNEMIKLEESIDRIKESSKRIKQKELLLVENIASLQHVITKQPT